MPMPMLLWLPMIMMAGLYEAITDDFRLAVRVIGLNNRDEG